MDVPVISVVIPVYNEGMHLSDSLEKIRGILMDLNIKFELILVDDGSSDNTWSVIFEESERNNSDVTAIRLSRNFGKESALCAGLDRVKGQACIVMDADLQHPPSLIPNMYKLWKEGYEVVECVKSSRGNENIFNKLSAKFFYRLLKLLSGFDLEGASDFKLLDNKVLSSYKKMTEHSTFFRGMSAWIGYKRATIDFAVSPRAGGKTTWSKIKLMRLAISAITSYSSLPLQIVTFTGVLFLAGSILLSIQTLYKYFAGIAFTGFTTVILLLLIIGSTLMISLGIIGTYIARIYEEVKNRPRYIVAEEITYDAAGEDF